MTTKIGTVGRVFGIVVALGALGAAVSGCQVLKILQALSGSQKYACLAYNDTNHRYGWATDQSTEIQATSVAIANCGAGCTARLTWHEGCGAYAEGGANNTFYGWALGTTRFDAETKAKANCAHAGGGTCTVRVWACNSRK